MPNAQMRALKPDYRNAIEAALKEWVVEQGPAVGEALDPQAISHLSGRIMRKVRDAGIAIGLDDGTDYDGRI